MTSAYQWIYSAKKSNERKTVLLLFLFPLFLYIMLYFFAVISGTGGSQHTTQSVNQIFFIYLLPFLWICLLITFFWQKGVIFWFTGAREITRKENPEIYNLVENLCISKGLSTPKIWVINTPGLNAFATGRRTSDSWIVFTSGLLQKLNKREVEAVAAHELSHIINKDSMLMMVIIIFIGCITSIGQTLSRIGKIGDYQNNHYRLFNNSSKDKGSILGIFLVIWGIFLFLGYFVYPLLKFAISQKREFIADLGSIELTKDAPALISALQKIAENSRVPRVAPNVAMIFIASPNSITKTIKDVPQFQITEAKNREIEIEKNTSIQDTHPSIDERISALKNY